MDLRRRTGNALRVPWGFIWLMVILKIPIIALLVLVWWAIRSSEGGPEGDEGGGGDDGGSKVRHPRSLPRRPRPRGPHGGQMLPAPSRVRRAPARARPHTPLRGGRTPGRI